MLNTKHLIMAILHCLQAAAIPDAADLEMRAAMWNEELACQPCHKCYGPIEEEIDRQTLT